MYDFKDTATFLAKKRAEDPKGIYVSVESADVEEEEEDDEGTDDDNAAPTAPEAPTAPATAKRTIRVGGGAEELPAILLCLTYIGCLFLLRSPMAMVDGTHLTGGKTGSAGRELVVITCMDRDGHTFPVGFFFLVVNNAKLVETAMNVLMQKLHEQFGTRWLPKVIFTDDCSKCKCIQTCFTATLLTACCS